MLLHRLALDDRGSVTGSGGMREKFVTQGVCSSREVITESVSVAVTSEVRGTQLIYETETSVAVIQ